MTTDHVNPIILTEEDKKQLEAEIRQHKPTDAEMLAECAAGNRARWEAIERERALLRPLSDAELIARRDELRKEWTAHRATYRRIDYATADADDRVASTEYQQGLIRIWHATGLVLGEIVKRKPSAAFLTSAESQRLLAAADAALTRFWHAGIVADSSSILEPMLDEDGCHELQHDIDRVEAASINSSSACFVSAGRKSNGSTLSKAATSKAWACTMTSCASERSRRISCRVGRRRKLATSR
jgi:hypothetical protein